MEILESTNGSVLVLQLKGRLDTSSSPVAAQRITQLLDGGASQVVLNLTGLEFVSSAGLRVFLSAAKRLKSNQGKLAFCGLQESVKELFEIAGFTGLFPILATQEEAVQNVQ